ncbi:kinase-like domain-containing protein [Crassisporium funariophilum]|nr:kinase-like domain-containing protein [Crassisporium funariophilum]
MGRVAATELMPDFTGRILKHGRFRLLESLGAGAYGKVYRAVDTTASSQTCYAVKCLNKPEPGSHTDILQQREFALHKLVSGHPNIVTLHEHFSDGLHVYVVMDLCTGGDLFAAITEKHLFYNNGRLIKRAFVQLIDAVQYCHDFGVFHRDIKPENVLCSADGTDVRLADFGLSIKSAVCQDFGCGSSYYMSPECIGREITSGKYSTRHNDIWALGVILTNMITGRNPWRYATADDDCFSAYLHDNDFLRQVLPISEGVNTVLKRIFTINPLRRITLPELRKEIMGLKAFFINDEEHTEVRCEVHKEVKVEIRQAPKAKPQRATISNFRIVSSNGLSEGNSEERYVFGSPVDDHLPSSDHHRGKLVDVSRSTSSNNFVIGGFDGSLSVPSSYSSGSDPESKGPITPATYAIDPALQVPEIPSEERLGDPALSYGDDTAKLIRPRSKGKRIHAHLFRSAVQRIKGLSSPSTST